MRVLGCTDKGLVRESNEDNYFVKLFSDTHAFALVCDGMGGAAYGEEASKLTVDIVADHVSENFRDDMTAEDARRILIEAFEKANKDVFEYSLKTADHLGMGTTAIASFVIKDKVISAYVGDSRIYLISGKTATLISKDHSVVQAMVDTGEISEEEARRHPQRNIITRAIGTLDTVDVDTSEYPIGDSDIVVLCSDGLSDYVLPHEIAEQMSVDFEKSLTNLIDLANSRGGSDNITIAAIAR